MHHSVIGKYLMHDGTWHWPKKMFWLLQYIQS